MKRSQVAILTSAITLGAIAGAVVGLASVDAQVWLRGPMYASPRYAGFGGPWRALLEGAYAMWAGAVAGARGMWLLLGVGSRAARRTPLVGGRLMWADIVVAGVVALWAYLVWASW
jgi:hypothetical protein